MALACVLCELAGKPIANPLPIENRRKLYERLLCDLQQREAKRAGPGTLVRYVVPPPLSPALKMTIYPQTAPARRGRHAALRRRAPWVLGAPAPRGTCESDAGAVGPCEAAEGGERRCDVGGGCGAT
jgi:hypothetical protein